MRPLPNHFLFAQADPFRIVTKSQSAMDQEFPEVPEHHVSKEDFKNSEDQRYVTKIKHFDSLKQARSHPPQLNTVSQPLEDLPESVGDDEIPVEYIKQKEKLSHRRREKLKTLGSSGSTHGRRKSIEDFVATDDMKFTKKITAFDSTGSLKGKKFLHGNRLQENPLEPLKEASHVDHHRMGQLKDQAFVSRIKRWDSTLGRGSRVGYSPSKSQIPLLPTQEQSSPSRQDFMDKLRRWNTQRTSPVQHPYPSPMQPHTTRPVFQAPQYPHEVDRFVDRVQRYDSLTGRNVPPVQKGPFRPQVPRVPEMDNPIISRDQRFVDQVRRYNSITGQRDAGPFQSRRMPYSQVMSPVSEHSYERDADFSALEDQKFADKVMRYNSITGRSQETPVMYQTYAPALQEVAEEYHRQRNVPESFQDLGDQKFIRQVQRFNSITGTRTESPVLSAYHPNVSIVHELPQQFYQTPFEASDYQHLGDQRFVQNLQRYNSITGQVTSPRNVLGFKPSLAPTQERTILDQIQRYNSLTGSTNPLVNPHNFSPLLEVFHEEPLRYDSMESEPIISEVGLKRYETLELWKKQLEELRDAEEPVVRATRPRSVSSIDNRSESIGRKRNSISSDFKHELLQLQKEEVKQKMEEIEAKEKRLRSIESKAFYDFNFADRIRKRDTISRMKLEADPELERIAAQRGRIANAEIPEGDSNSSTEPLERIMTRQLLESIRLLKEKEAINYAQVILLKSLVIVRDAFVIECYEKFMDTRDEKGLETDLMSIAIEYSICDE